MVRIEIELIGDDIRNEIYELRNFLKEQTRDVDLMIKEQPASEGQMSLGLAEPILNGVLHAATAIAFEELYRNLLKPLLLNWLKGRKSAGIQLEVMSSLSDSAEKVHFLEDSSGHTQTYNYKYKIDTAKTFVLLIGVGNFTNDFHAIPPVQGNLEDLCRLLANKKHIGIPRENIVVSYNESHVEIQKHLLQAGRRPDVQTLIIYFAGHGHRTDIKKLSLIAADTEKIGDEVIGGIDFDFISNKVLKNSFATQKILILDTCHSGIATQGEDDLVQNFDVKGSYILTSSPGDDVSYFEKNARHTFFTGALLDVLEHGVDNTNDMLALEDLYDYTKDALAEKKFPHPSARSELNIPASDFFIARNPSFSSEKLKWKANNLFRDGKLEEAMDELRKLMKRFPDDEALRKLFVECETELSFSKLVNEANALFYQGKNFKQASLLYRKAYELKKDAMVMEKIRQCEQTNLPSPPPDPLLPLKEDANFIAFQKASERKAFYAAYQYLKKLRQSFPKSDFVTDEIRQLENKLSNLADPGNDERLAQYHHYADAGDFQKALVALKGAISNDPDYPVFFQLQNALARKIKEQKQRSKEERNPLFFRLFETFGKGGRLIILSSLGVLVAVVIVFAFFIRGESDKSIAGLKAMLKSDVDKALPLLKEKAKKNDSAKLVLGDYYRDAGDYITASLWYVDARLPAAKSAIGAMYYLKQMSDTADTAKAGYYFETALKLGVDTNASTYLGMIALNKYNSKDDNIFSEIFGENQNWTEAEKNFKEGWRNGSVLSKQMLADLYFKKAKKSLSNKYYDNAHTYFLKAIQYENSDAMVDLGYLFQNTAWQDHNVDSAAMWYKSAMRHKHVVAFNNYATILMRKENDGPSRYDSAYDILWQGINIDTTLSYLYYNLGVTFENGGVNVHKRSDSATYYYRKAADKGNQLGTDALKRLGVEY